MDGRPNGLAHQIDIAGRQLPLIHAPLNGAPETIEAAQPGLGGRFATFGVGVGITVFGRIRSRECHHIMLRMFETEADIAVQPLAETGERIGFSGGQCFEPLGQFIENLLGDGGKNVEFVAEIEINGRRGVLNSFGNFAERKAGISRLYDESGGGVDDSATKRLFLASSAFGNAHLMAAVNLPHTVPQMQTVPRGSGLPYFTFSGDNDISGMFHDRAVHTAARRGAD